MRIIPPMKAVICFEAAARLKSFKLAAVELNVTPGAISHQIAALENFVGKELFDRSHRQLELTHSGRKYFARVAIILQNMEEATIDLGVQGHSPSLRVAVPPSLLKNWLLPRMSQSHIYHKGISIEFIDTLEYLDFGSTGLDLAIRYGYDSWDNYYSVHLFDEEMVAVCHPEYCAVNYDSLTQNAVDNMTLIYTNNRLVQWDIVLQYFGIERRAQQSRLVFQNSVQAIEAAVLGAGIAYVNRLLVEKELEKQRLVIPFEIRMPEHKSPSYHLVSTFERMQHESTALIYQSILEEVKRIPERSSVSTGRQRLGCSTPSG
ncbi:LysR substrate-binding domain-containing protein [Shewanella algae]|uniref:LysR substrate-binding domain-containing protein n=1 Tax=Shewanella algae TaxID=38313 RepID=UPI002556B0B4|nr:LysR substrate-binding domain-containing protein [Shewanella algae]MDL2194420.1 LysR substrate-binding domain-containing protein [Shewanella algae]MDL2196541.1 LysR substrate-binding domain-containing protein [Shewanella algae]